MIYSVAITKPYNEWSFDVIMLYYMFSILVNLPKQL